MEIKNHNEEKLKERIDNMRVYLRNGNFVEVKNGECWSSSGELMGRIQPEQMLKKILEVGVQYKNNECIDGGNDEIEKLKKQLDDANRTIHRLNLEAQRWFDMSMDLLHKEEKAIKE